MTAPSELLLARAQIHDIVNAFAAAFDAGDWDALRSCLDDHVAIDYSELRGDPPSTVRADAYVDRRRGALQPLRTLHLLANHRIEVDDDRATCLAAMTILRHDPRRTSPAHFNTFGHYEFGLRKTRDGWRISSIVQKVYWNDGDSTIHSGVKRRNLEENEA